MSWGKSRNLDRIRGRRAEYNFKNIVEKNPLFEVFLTQENHEKIGRDGPYRIGSFIAGDADILCKTLSRKIIHCEIKVKYPDSYNHYGIELYRLSEYLLIEKKFNLPVYYVIKNTQDNNWIYRRFIDLWEKIKEGFQLFINYKEIASNNVYTIKDQVLYKIREVQKNYGDRIFLKLDEISKFCSIVNGKSDGFGKIRLHDKSYYYGKNLWKATLIYFDRKLFRPLNHIYSEIKNL